MVRTPLLNGKNWNLVRKIGEGVTGVVYLVEDNGQKAILKQPSPSILDAQRQAPQITNEGNILDALLRIPELTSGLRLRFTTLLGRSEAGEAVEKCYLLMERAPGFSLTDLARVANFGIEKSGILFDELSSTEKLFLRTIESSKHVPDLIVLQSLDVLLNLFPRLHNNKFNVNGTLRHGIIWNDVKPDHLYWDVNTQSFTIIDWGNSQFLEEDQVTRDRQFSSNDDYRQFSSEMGKFLAENNSKLRIELGWHANIASDIYELQKTIKSLINSTEANLRQLRIQEISFLSQEQIEDVNKLKELRTLHEGIFKFGYLPDFFGAIEFCKKILRDLLAGQDLVSMEKVALWPIREEYPNIDADYWRRVAYIISVLKNNNLYSPLAIQYAIKEDWRNTYWCLWELTIEDNHDPDWWNDVGQRLRAFLLEIESDIEVPLKTLYDIHSEFLGKASESEILKTLAEIIKRWREVDPTPPNAGLEYVDIKNLIGKIEEHKRRSSSENEFYSKITDTLTRKISFIQIIAQEKNFFSAWNNLNFDQAKEILKILVVWDPDRRRIHSIAKLIDEAILWVQEIRNKDLDVQAQIDNLNIRGQYLLNSVGKANWLQIYLEFLELLRKKEDSPKALAYLENKPELINELQWLNNYVDNTIKGRIRDSELNKFYDLLMEWKWSPAEEILSHASLQQWQDAYKNLIEALKGARIGEMKLKNNKYAPHDNNWQEAEAVVKSIYEWRITARERGCVDAKRVLRQAKVPHNWQLFENIKIIQERLDTKLNLFRSLEHGNNWNKARDLLGDIPAKSILEDAISKFNSASSAWFEPSPMEGRLSKINEYVQAGIRQYNQWEKICVDEAKTDFQRVVVSVADWKRFKKRIISMGEVSALALQSERLLGSRTNRFYKGEPILLAQNYLKQLNDLELLLGIEAEFSQAKIWQENFRKIQNGDINLKKSIQNKIHPMQQWLLGAPDKGFRSNSSRNRIVIASMITIVCLGFGFGLFLFSPQITNYIKYGLRNPTAVQTAEMPTNEVPATSQQPESATPTPNVVSCDDFLNPLSTSAALLLENNIQILTVEEYEELVIKCQIDPHSLAELRLNRLVNLSEELSSSDEMKIVSDVYRRLGIELPISEIQESDSVSRAQWMRVTLALCDLRKKTTLTSEQVATVQEYLDWHLGKYLESESNYFNNICSVTPEDFKAQLEMNNIGYVSEIDLAQEALWPPVDWSVTPPPCFYYQNGSPQILMSSASGRTDPSFCTLETQLEEFRAYDSIVGVRAQFCGYQVPANPSDFGYGIVFLQNGGGVMMRLERFEQSEVVVLYQLSKDKMIALDQSISFTDGVVYKQIILPSDQCVVRTMLHPVIVGRVIIWKMQTQESEQEKILGLYAGLLDEKTIDQELRFGFASWLPPDTVESNLRFSFSELILEKR